MKVKLLSPVRLFVTPWTVAHQAPPSMGFSGKNTGVGCHFLISPLDNSLFVVYEVGVQEGQVSPAEMRSELGTTDVAGDRTVQEEVQRSLPVS